MERWNQIQPDIFWKMLHEEGLDPALIIDVREQEEWDYYHLNGSTLLPLSSFQETWEQVPMDRPVYIICAHGVRSQAVCRYLNEKGYGSLANVVGGMAAVSHFDGFQYD
ncbi:rhodanese-like domain-containing protein [Paenibacillus rhizovicinus]|uniref:Rhodanese-like domain-containing protein n=1 Tax=Paenibacillus rhizovicinus TaxID=2704463 RepID=A0A6C0NVK3_9BACL|nr:rhodanese-like domain-containing protein [Paenibacillus rhizovicinus]QHW30219.1 rhodanese-like domain-containing protein [Paenibacillus rhizovicinus]